MPAPRLVLARNRNQGGLSHGAKRKASAVRPAKSAQDQRGNASGPREPPRLPRMKNEMAAARQCPHARAGRSRHVGRHDDDEEVQHGLESRPGWHSFERWGSLGFTSSIGNICRSDPPAMTNAAKQGKLEDQQASVFDSDQARKVTDKVPCQKRPAHQDDAHRDDREPGKAAQETAANCRVSSGTGPAPINKISAGNSPSQTPNARRCAMEAERPRSADQK